MRVAFHGADALEEVAARLDGAAVDVRRQIENALSETAKPAAQAVRAAAARVSRHIPATITTRSSLTAGQAGVSILAESSKMPPGHEALPGLMELGSDAGHTSWRHPVFGDRKKWVRQSTHRYFYRPALAAADAALQAQIVQVANKLSEEAGFK